MNKVLRGLFNFYKKEGLEKKSCECARPLRQVRIDQLTRFLVEGNLLDVGCAEGLDLTLLSDQEKLAHLVGVEVSRPKLLRARASIKRET